MINSTLGGLIKDYRLQKGLSQFDIAFALGWKETSRLSRIEQGRTERPSRELLDKIIIAIGFEEEEKNTLLLTGGYLPTEEEILKVKKETENFIKEWPYPASLNDFSWRVIDANIHICEIFGMSSDYIKDLYKSEVRILDVMVNFFNKDYEKLLRRHTSTRPTFLKDLISQFKHEQRHRTKEKWFVEHVRKLMGNEQFRELWVEVNSKSNTEMVLGKHLKRQFINPKNKDKLLSFYIFIAPVLKDPRFEVSLKVPADLETYNFYH